MYKLEWKEKDGVFTANPKFGNIRFIIVNCHLQPKHKLAVGTNFYLSMGKITPVPIGDFWSEETAKEAAENLYRYLDQEIGAL
jgi:hypothetical protein